MERALGHLLRGGVLLAAAVVMAGGAVFLARHHGAQAGFKTFVGEPEDLRSLRGILSGVKAIKGRSIIQFGVLLLVATPIARVTFSAFSFVRERDWLYVALTAAVLALLLYGLVSG
jgi:uncharacterized membrane protein